MYCVIFGAGVAGSRMAGIFDSKGYRVTVVDIDRDAIKKLESRADVRVLTGDIISKEVLDLAEVGAADLVVCLTERDADNILGGMLCKQAGCRKVIARVRSNAFLAGREETFHDDFGIDEVICPETLTAEEIAKRIATPGVSAIEFFADNKVRLRELDVPEDSKYIGVPFKDVAFAGKALVPAIFRDGRTIIPNGETSLESGDSFLVIGEPDAVRNIGHEFGDVMLRKRDVVIAGSSNIAIALAGILDDTGKRVKLICDNQKECKAISEVLSKTLVLNGSIFDPAFLAEAGVGSCDAFIAAAQNDENNILAALAAKEAGAREVLAIVDNPAMIPVVRRIGIDTAVSPRLVTASRVVRSVLSERVRSLAVISQYETDTLEISIPADSKRTGIPLKDLGLPAGVIVCSIVRGEDVLIPGGDDVLKPGDSIIVFTMMKNVSAVGDLF